MRKLVLNKGYGVQFEGDHHPNGHPKNIAKVHYKENAHGLDEGFADRVDVVREMVDLWNAKYATMLPIECPFCGRKHETPRCNDDPKKAEKAIITCPDCYNGGFGTTTYLDADGKELNFDDQH